MQTSRLLPAVAAIVLCASAFSTRADDTPAQAAARQALMQDMNGTDNTETPTPPPATPVPPPVIVPPPPAPVIPPPVPSMTMETNMPAPPAPVSTAPAAAQGSSSNLVVPPVEQEVPPATQATQYPVNPPPTNPSITPTNMPSSTPVITPGAANEGPSAPPLPLTDGQQQQLQALLQQYEANQISPAQYQAARAKILAGQ